MSNERVYLSSNEQLPTVNWTTEWEPWMLDEMEKCNDDIVHFAENYFFIVDPDYGKVKIKLYECQKEALISFKENRYNAIVASRQIGKTTIVTIFALWTALFKKDQNIFVLANKEDTAKMILSRIRMAYEQMDNWIKSPIKEFTKTKMVFGNDSSINTAATSEQGIRGQACNVLILDEFAFIRPEIAHAFYEAVWPTISRSRTSKVIMSSTPNGTTGKFYEIYSQGELGEDHKDWNNFHTSKIMWDEMPRFNAKGEIDFAGFKKEQIAGFSGDMDSWYQEFCCVFHESGAVAVNLSVLEELKKRIKKPIYTFDEGDYLVWEEPQAGHIYTIGVDTAEGLGLDYSVAQIMDITDLTDIRQVAQYHSNMVQPYVYAEKLNKIARAWGKPYMSIERNGCGGQVIDALYNVHKYDNIVHYAMNNDARGMYQKMGVYCHTNSKYTGIMNMKYWVETLLAVTIYDRATLKEYETFRRKNNGTWAAQEKFHDDRIMAMIWALLPLETEIAQRYFNVLQYDDVGKPKMIQDPNGEFEKYLGPLWADNDHAIQIGDPAPMLLGVSSNEFNHTPHQKDMMDMGTQGWTIL